LDRAPATVKFEHQVIAEAESAEMNTKAIRVHEHGGPEVLKWEDIPLPEPGPGEVRLRHRAIGLNFVEIYFRTGLYPPPHLPYVPGTEAAGVVEALGPGVSEFRVGDRVAYCGGPFGAYSEARVIPAKFLVPIPAGIDEATAAASMLKGLTAHYLLFSTYQVKAGDQILVHAAAGGVGLLLCQWAKHLGATVIGTVGSEEKARVAAQHGCDHTILYHKEDFVTRVRELSGGKGVPVVYDSVGQATFMGSLDCLKPRGLMVSFGQASGAVAPFNVGILSAKGSLYLTRPTLVSYVAEREELLSRAQALFDALARGVVRCEVRRRFPLKNAAEAHRALASRETIGSSILIP
jgi:NADPH2:quinone reductase